MGRSLSSKRQSPALPKRKPVEPIEHSIVISPKREPLNPEPRAESPIPLKSQSPTVPNPSEVKGILSMVGHSLMVIVHENSPKNLSKVPINKPKAMKEEPIVNPKQIKKDKGKNPKREDQIDRIQKNTQKKTKNIAESLSPPIIEIPVEKEEETSKPVVVAPPPPPQKTVEIETARVSIVPRQRPTSNDLEASPNTFQEWNLEKKELINVPPPFTPNDENDWW